MKLSELIQHVGDDNVILQNILHSSPTMNVGKKDGRITFSTDRQKTGDLCTQGATGQKGQWTALVVWIPTDKLPA